MRKILAGFLATSMVVSMSAMVSAATVSPSIDIALDKVTSVVTAGAVSTAPTGITGDAVIKSKINALNITAGETVINVPMNLEKEIKSPHGWTTGTSLTLTTPQDLFTASELQTALVGKKVSAKFDGKVYNGSFVKNGSDVKLQFDGAAVSFSAATLAWDQVTTVDVSGLIFNPTTVTISQLPTVAFTPGATIAATVTKGNSDEAADVEITGDFFKDLGLKNVVLCDGYGNPLPMTEKGAGVGNDLNGSDGVQSDRTLYFMINDSVVPTFKDDNMWKIKASKGDNGKIIKSITDTTKIFSAPLVNANTNDTIKNVSFTERHRYLKVELNELYTDDEYKVTLDLRLTPTSRAETKYNISGDEIKVRDFSFWVKNIVKSADSDWRVGLSGLMLSPVTNDWNNVTYHDEESDVAFVRFFGDSDVGKFYAKLSTKWVHADYAAYFNDQDAYYFEFTGSPKLSSTSRADLQIYNPFTDEDGNETIDPSTATIYQIVDGDLIDVTDSFTYGEGDNGEDAFITRTRFLGSYIICEKPVEEAVSEEDIDDLMPDEEEMPVAPITPDTNAGGKNPANTGRYA